MSPSHSRILIAVIAFDRVIPFHMAVPCLVFDEGVPRDNPFDVVVCAGESRTIETTSGFALSKLAPMSLVRDAAAVVVPGWRDVDEKPPAQLLDLLRDAHARGSQIVGLCLGTYVLAEAGLLSGRLATTHWEYAEHLSRKYPDIRVDANVLYVEDGNVLTSAGTAASLDACLHVLRQRLGAEVANRAARRLCLAPHREGGQAQFIEQPLPTTDGSTRLARLIENVRERLDAPHTLDSLASEVCMSRRSFTRHFKALTGTTVHAWLLAERLALSQRLLETSEETVERVAQTAGFGSAVSLRHHFRRAFGISPTAWRRNFGIRPNVRQTATGQRQHGASMRDVSLAN